MPRIVDHHQYRKELLSKCFDLFARKGYSAITMREIALDIGVSTGTLYHYFSNKKALFEQLVEEISRQDILMVTAELQKTYSCIIVNKLAYIYKIFLRHPQVRRPT